MRGGRAYAQQQYLAGNVDPWQRRIWPLRMMCMISYAVCFSARRRIGLLDQLEFASLETMVLLEDIGQDLTVYIDSSSLVVYCRSRKERMCGMRFQPECLLP